MVHIEPRAEAARFSLRDSAGILDPARPSVWADGRSPGSRPGLGVSS